MDIRYFLDKKIGWPLLCAGVRLSHAPRDMADWVKAVHKAGCAVRAARRVAWNDPFCNNVMQKLEDAKQKRRMLFGIGKKR